MQKTIRANGSLSDSPHTSQPPHAEAHSPVWDALCDDPQTAVMLVDSEGHVHFANATAASLCGRPADGQAPSLKNILSEDVARERLEFVREASNSGKSITVDGMINGRYTRSTLRPFPTERADQRRILMVTRPATPMPDPEASGIVRAKSDDHGVLSSLTTREMEILRLIAAGLSTADIADQLHRSVKTVEWHRVSLGNKLGITNRVELARIAINAGLVATDTARGVTKR